jgi:hypothetical protein
MRILKGLRARGVYLEVNGKGGYLPEGIEGPRGGRSLSQSRRKPFEGSRVINHARIKHSLYYPYNICQGVNKSFECWRLGREKSLPDRPLGWEFLSALLVRVAWRHFARNGHLWVGLTQNPHAVEVDAIGVCDAWPVERLFWPPNWNHIRNSRQTSQPPH